MNNAMPVKSLAFDQAHPPTPLSVSVKVWAGLVAFLVLVKGVITFFPATFSAAILMRGAYYMIWHVIYVH